MAVVAGDHGDEPTRVPPRRPGGLDQLRAAGEIPLTIDALGPRATYVAAILVEAENVTFGDLGYDCLRVTLSGRAATEGAGRGAVP